MLLSYPMMQQEQIDFYRINLDIIFQRSYYLFSFSHIVVHVLSINFHLIYLAFESNNNYRINLNFTLSKHSKMTLNTILNLNDHIEIKF